MSFVTKVLELMKGGDENKIKRFHKKLLKEVDDQIEVRNRDIEDIKDKFIDLDDKEFDIIYNINIDSIKTLEETKDYVDSYLEKIIKCKKERSKHQDQIKEKKKEIEYFKDLKKTLEANDK